MLASLFSLGARLAVRDASAAIRRGDLDGATAICRAHLATRLPIVKLPLRGPDAVVAALVALCATLRDDPDEVVGAAALLEGDGDRTTGRASAATSWCVAAMEGEIERVLTGTPGLDPLWSEVASQVVLDAAERTLGEMPRALVPEVRARLATGLTTPELRARAAVVLARLAVVEGDHAGAREALSVIPEAAAAPFRALAAMARQDVDAAIEAAKGLRARERDASLGFGAALALAAGAQDTDSILEKVGPHLSGPVRATLAATRAVALARAGDRDEAGAVLAAEKERFAAEPEKAKPSKAAAKARAGAATSLAIAGAYAALAGRDGARAREALRDAPREDPAVASLALAALAASGDAPDLMGELRGLPAPPPDRHAAVLRPLILATLARAGAPGELPDWLRVPPPDPAGLYAWALVRLQQGAADEARKAFEEALKRAPDLAGLGDAPDVARLAVARERLAAGDTAGARALAAAVKSARLAGTAARLSAFALVKERASERAQTLRRHTLPNFVDELRRGASGAEEIALLDRVRVDAGLLRVRTLLCDGKAAEARAALEPFRAPQGGAGAQAGGAGEDPDVTFLAAAIDLCEGRSPLAEVESTLRASLERSPDHPALQALLAEVSIALRGREAGIELLEAARARVKSSVLEQALASAYQSANRGLDAKRLGLAAVRRSAGAARRELSRELGHILAFEAPPRREDRSEAPIKRRPARSALPAEGIAGRAHVLFAHAATAMERDPQLRPALEPLVQKMKRSLVTEDVADALATEREILGLTRRARR